MRPDRDQGDGASRGGAPWSLRHLGRSVAARAEIVAGNDHRWLFSAVLAARAHANLLLVLVVRHSVENKWRIAALHSLMAGYERRLD